MEPECDGLCARANQAERDRDAATARAERAEAAEQVIEVRYRDRLDGAQESRNYWTRRALAAEQRAEEAEATVINLQFQCHHLSQTLGRIQALREQWLNGDQSWMWVAGRDILAALDGDGQP